MPNAKAKANPKQDKAASVAAAKSKVEGYHEGATLEDKLHRKQIIIHLLVCLVTSDWWLANSHTMRTDMIHHIVQVDDTMDALDVIYNE
jgi:hypothetical protein